MSNGAHADIVAHFRHGINLSHWYAQVYGGLGYVPEYFERYMDASDLDLIASAGFDHVRLPLSVENLFATDASLNADFASRVDREVDRLHACGLAVILDFHPELEYRAALARSDLAAEVFVDSWRRFARHHAGRDPSITAFELLNEPGIDNAERWGRIIRATTAGIRDGAPDHAIVVSGDHYSEVDRLVEVPEIDAERIIYNIHLYDPYVLSHQGADFGPDWIQRLDRIEYPYEASDDARLRAQTADPTAMRALDEYRDAQWDANAYAQLIAPAVDFARERQAPLTCNEFGMYRAASDPDSRARWLRDLVSVFDEFDLGWCMWDYAGDFAVATGAPGARRLDENMLAALGLPSRGASVASAFE
jgi:endoglucanase